MPKTFLTNNPFKRPCAGVAPSVTIARPTGRSVYQGCYYSEGSHAHAYQYIRAAPYIVYSVGPYEALSYIGSSVTRLHNMGGWGVVVGGVGGVGWWVGYVVVGWCVGWAGWGGGWGGWGVDGWGGGWADGVFFFIVGARKIDIVAGGPICTFLDLSKHRFSKNYVLVRYISSMTA